MIQKQIYFITATNTNVGKTKASEIFLNKFYNDGFKVGYFKPIETGVDTIPQDGTKMLDLTKKLNPSFDVTINDVVPYQFKLPASPYVASNQTNIDIDFIKSKASYLLKFCDVLIIEGAGGLMVPIKQDYFMIDLIKEFQCKTILISPSFLGSINDTLLSQMALKNANIKYNWYINLYKNKQEFQKITLPFYKNYFKDIKYLDANLHL
jgi:dethiobiotin synthetase